MSHLVTCGVLGAAVSLVLPILCAIFPVGFWLARPLVVTDAVRSVDAIVVLGAGAYDATTLTPDSAYRLLRGIQLLKAGHTKMLILTGGSHHGTRVSDANAMAQVAVGLGVDKESLIVDETPSATWEQAASVAGIAHARAFRSIALVTSPLHSYRARRVFRRAGLEVVSVPAGPDLDARLLTVAQDHVAGRTELLVRAVYEYLAIGAYLVRGRL
jgi:uncharacterized SAM-binding protein YcdF (DUF218 family)